MNIQTVKEPFAYIVIDNFYDEKELFDVEQEVKQWASFMLQNNIKDVQPAIQNGEHLQTNAHNLFIDTYCQNISQSKILSYNKKLFSKDVTDAAESVSPFFRHISRCTSNYTMISLYKSGGEYKPHYDCSVISSVTFFNIGDYSGGEFCFTDYGIEIESKPNRTVIFSGCMQHNAKSIQSKDNGYRVSIANFMNYK